MKGAATSTRNGNSKAGTEIGRGEESSPVTSGLNNMRGNGRRRERKKDPKAESEVL